MAEPAVVVLQDEDGKVRKWKKLIKLCEEIKFGEVTLKIQDGIPQSAEKVTQRVRFD